MIGSLPERSLVVLNKQDLAARITGRQLRDWRELPVADVSALTGTGLNDLRRALVDILGIGGYNAGSMVHVTVSERHRRESMAARAALSQAGEHLDTGGTGLILAARELKQAAEAIGLIIGRTYTDDLLDLIFSRFCVGK